MDPRNLRIADYDYPLPENRIADHPLAERDASRLLVYRGGGIHETTYRRIADEIPEGATLFFNDTRVLDARLLFTKESGGTIEIFTLDPAGHYPDMETALNERGSVEWNCLVGGASKWKRGMVLEKKAGEIILKARFVEKQTDSFVVEFSWMPLGLHFAEVLHHLGSIPLPPYLKRDADAADAERYQTIYAASEGSVAAPTAGLHFTPQIFDSLLEKKIDTEYTTLHVGAGTFMPVKSDRLADHTMHEEFIEVRADTLERLLRKSSGPVIAVGTTSLRTMESLYWLGMKVAENKGISSSALNVDQWDPYQMDSGMDTMEALHFLLEWIRQQPEQKLITKTRLFILPGYQFKIINGLISNFHQPQSTLLLLVAALVGEEWKKIYQYALENDFRFLSYGDGCLFLPD